MSATVAWLKTLEVMLGTGVQTRRDGQAVVEANTALVHFDPHGPCCYGAEIDWETLVRKTKLEIDNEEMELVVEGLANKERASILYAHNMEIVAPMHFMRRADSLHTAVFVPEVEALRELPRLLFTTSLRAWRAVADLNGRLSAPCRLGRVSLFMGSLWVSTDEVERARLLTLPPADEAGALDAIQLATLPRETKALQDLASFEARVIGELDTAAANDRAPLFSEL